MVETSMVAIELFNRFLVLEVFPGLPTTGSVVQFYKDIVSPFAKQTVDRVHLGRVYPLACRRFENDSRFKGVPTGRLAISRSQVAQVQIRRRRRQLRGECSDVATLVSLKWFGHSSIYSCRCGEQKNQMNHVQGELRESRKGGWNPLRDRLESVARRKDAFGWNGVGLFCGGAEDDIFTREKGFRGRRTQKRHIGIKLRGQRRVATRNPGIQNSPVYLGVGESRIGATRLGSETSYRHQRGRTLVCFCRKSLLLLPRPLPLDPPVLSPGLGPTYGCVG